MSFMHHVANRPNVKPVEDNNRGNNMNDDMPLRCRLDGQ